MNVPHSIGRLLALAIVIAFASAASADSFVDVTWNCEWLFDEDASDDSSNIGPTMAAPSGEEYESRVRGFADAIAPLGPSVIALQEVENAKVAQDLADALGDHGLAYSAEFVQGRDTHTGQDVACLVRASQPFDAKRFDFATHAGDPEFKNLSKHVWLTITSGERTIQLVTVHLITRRNDRMRQARTLRAWTQFLARTGGLVILGDANTGSAST